MKIKGNPNTLDAGAFPIPAGQFATNLVALLKMSGQEHIVKLLDSSIAELSASDFDNWNGGTTGWDLLLRLDMAVFGRLPVADKEEIERVVRGQASRLVGEFPHHHIPRVNIVPNLLAAESALLPDYDETRGYAGKEQFFQARELEFVRPLASGGFGEVVIVKRRHLGTELAVKFFDPHPLVVDSEQRRQKARARLLREARLLASIRHQNVVRLFDCAMISGDPVLVLEFVDGSTLDAIRQQRGPMPSSDAVPLIAQVLDALAACHAREIFHRDVSPRNVVVDRTGRVVLIDFGLGLSGELIDGARLTTQPMGTPGFRAPELESDPLAAKSAIDIFGAGALAVFLLTGRPPQLGLPLEIPEAPRALISLLQQSVEVDPRRRIQSAAEFGQALRACVAGRNTAGRTIVTAHGLSEEDVREHLGIEVRGEVEQEVSVLVGQFAIAVDSLVVTEKNLEVGLATLLVVARHQIDVYLAAREPDNRCDASALIASLRSLMGLLSKSLQAFDVATVETWFAQSVAYGWLTEGKYDSWVPGMKSGSGWRKCYSPTSLGRRWLKAEARFDPAPER
ncbi:serine/threonine-protein kinase [Corallococcus sp. 4LFB]|uniref:serine/threonine-protein kinase n=1 Tax=Corallococcus sp. 4LFB TaxID=3383249 RepID=UPI003975872C